MNAVAISLKNITKSFEDTHILKGIDLEINRGEVTLVMGPSGSGKTTLLSIMGSILRPTTGSVNICGEEITTLSEKRLPYVRLNHIGFVFQAFNLIRSLTVAGNLKVSLGLKGIRGQTAKKRIVELLEQVGLGHKLNAYPRDLSGGQKQRVAIARALAGEPSIILADEPTASIDAENIQAVMDLLVSLAHDQNRAVVIVTHDNRLLEYADRIVQLENGMIAEDAASVLPDVLDELLLNIDEAQMPGQGKWLVLSHAPSKVREFIHIPK